MTEEQMVQDVLSNLKIENPCPMLLGRLKGDASNNYYCNSCEKTIVDFRDLSNEEALSKLKEGISCGIFYEDQLKGQEQIRPYNWIERATFYSFMFFSWVGFNVGPLQAQVAIPKWEKDNIQAVKKERSDKGLELKDAVKTIPREEVKEDVVKEKKKKPKRRRRRWRRRGIVGCPSW